MCYWGEWKGPWAGDEQLALQSQDSGSLEVQEGGGWGSWRGRPALGAAVVSAAAGLGTWDSRRGVTFQEPKDLLREGGGGLHVAGGGWRATGEGRAGGRAAAAPGSLSPAPRGWAAGRGAFRKRRAAGGTPGRRRHLCAGPAALTAVHEGGGGRPRTPVSPQLKQRRDATPRHPVPGRLPILSPGQRASGVGWKAIVAPKWGSRRQNPRTGSVPAMSDHSPFQPSSLVHAQKTRAEPLVRQTRTFQGNDRKSRWIISSHQLWGESEQSGCSGHREPKCPFLPKSERMQGKEGVTQGESWGRGGPSPFPLRADKGRKVKDKITEVCFPLIQSSRCWVSMSWLWYGPVILHDVTWVKRIALYYLS